MLSRDVHYEMNNVIHRINFLRLACLSSSSSSRTSMTRQQSPLRSETIITYFFGATMSCVFPPSNTTYWVRNMTSP